jgi:mono/diheme cytochrome c family protein
MIHGKQIEMNSRILSGLSYRGVNMRYVIPVLFAAFLSNGICLAQPDVAPSAERLFVSKVQPLLVDKCGGCHGDEAKKIKGDFDMRTLEGLLRGGESGEPALKPGAPNASPLFVSVTWQDSDLEMPPKENNRLSSQQIADLRAWIKAGAPWPEISGEQPAPLAPPTNGAVRVRTNGGQNETWTNRTYDPEKIWAFRPPRQVTPSAGGHPIDAFINATLVAHHLTPAPRAGKRTLNRRLAYTLTGLPPTATQLETEYETLLEQLLDSPHYGERMAQHWLDVTRYADSNGFARDEERPDAHIYRSYVIESFNADKPFDRFTREQIAGDELDLAGQDALAFLWMGPWEITAMTSAAVARQMWLDDVVNSVGVTFLGQELRCAQCHDHKFDPISTRDYYSMQAIFASTNHHVKEGNFKIQPQEAQKVSILKGGSLASPGEEVSPGLLSAVAGVLEAQAPSTQGGRRAALANWVADVRNPFTARVIVNRVWAWHFGRGIVATPNGFGSMGAAPSHPDLLDWLAVWFMDNGWSLKKLHHLILTSDAFQRSTSHPQIDKVREVDPNGQWLAAFNPRRLTAEEIRDSMLAVSGELTERIGGESFRAEINWEVAFQPRRVMGKLRVMAPWEPAARRDERHRRSIYAKRRRNVGYPLMEVLNRPPTELSCERRDETTVVTQAFSLFHGEFSNARALALADRAAKENPDNLKAQIASVFKFTYARTPTSAEATRSLAHVRDLIAHHRANPPQERPLPTEVTLARLAPKTGEPDPITFQLEGLKDYERDLQPWQVNAETRALAELCLVLLNSSEFLYVY